jgi:dipeptidase E
MQWADMIYISGGDTRHAVRIWVESGISAILSQRVCAGTVVACGISAGALAWFTGGCSDSDSYDVDSNQPWQYCEVEALGLFNSLACPHYNTLHPQTKERRSSAFAQMLFTREQNYIGWGIDNHAALQVIGRTAKVLSAKDNFVHRLTRTKRGIRNAILTPSCGTFTI